MRLRTVPKGISVVCCHPASLASIFNLNKTYLNGLSIFAQNVIITACSSATFVKASGFVKLCCDIVKVCFSSEAVLHSGP